MDAVHMHQIAYGGKRRSDFLSKIKWRHYSRTPNLLTMALNFTRHFEAERNEMDKPFTHEVKM
jgi:hypothetical protein